MASESARAEWRRTSDLELNTAYTLEEGALQLGIISPLTVGVTDAFQATFHPLLLLLGQPTLALRLRVTPVDDVTIALNVAGGWSFVQKEDRTGTPEAQARRTLPRPWTPDSNSERDVDVGYPGMLQLTATMTVRLGKAWLVSWGFGPAVDFLGGDPIRGAAEVHLSADWLITAKHLLMVQLSAYVPVTERVRLLRPEAQLLYGWAISDRVQLTAGLGFGDFIWSTSESHRTTFPVLPIVDLWFRF